MPEKDKSTNCTSHLTIGKIQTIIKLSKHIKTLILEKTGERILAIVAIIQDIFITGALIFWINTREATKQTAPV